MTPDTLSDPLEVRAIAWGPGLTPAERRVALLIRDGLSDKEIAVLLRTSLTTAEGHAKAVRRKYGGVTRARVASLVTDEVGL